MDWEEGNQNNNANVKKKEVTTRAVLCWLFPKMVNLPPKPVGFRITFIQ